MHTSSRRRFLAGSLVGAAVSASRALAADARPQGPPGAQIFNVKDLLVQDFDGTLRELAAMGYEVLEFCSPPGFTKMGMASLVDMKASEIRRKADAARLRFVSCHYQFPELQGHIGERIDFAKELGLDHMVIATYALPKTATLADWRRAAEESNRLGERTQKAGIQLAFHNHQGEFERIDGALIFDELMKRWDRQLVKCQFQVPIRDFDPAEVISRYPGRIASLHLGDSKPGVRGRVAVGQGTLDWKKFFASANVAGYKYYFVELAMDGLRASLPALKAM
jgi:sugar phosphate isomerase/epimerase